MDKIKSVRFIHNVSNVDLPLRGFMDSESLAINLKSRALIYADQQDDPQALAGDFTYDPTSFVGTPADPTAPPMEQLVSNLNQILAVTPPPVTQIPTKHINIWKGDTIKLMKYTGHVVEYMERDAGACRQNPTAVAVVDNIDLPETVSDLTGLTDGDIVPSEPYFDVYSNAGMLIIGNSIRKLENGSVSLESEDWQQRTSTCLSEGSFVLTVCIRYVVYQSGVPLADLEPAPGHEPTIYKRYIVDCRDRTTETITGESDEVTIY